MIARQQGDMKLAKKGLEEALRGFIEFPHTDLAEGLLLLTKAYLVTVYAALGNKGEAQKFYAETQAYLTAVGEKELLAECTQAAA
jgi:hypothetical protein